MADLDTIKIVLRSLLISTQRSMTFHDLQKDYRMSEGHECPYFQLGYSSFLAFLQSIPDTVTVYSSGQVKAVSTKETAHIQQLVALQKPSKKRSKRPSSSYHGSYSYGGGNRSSGPVGGFYAPGRSYGTAYKPYGGASRSYGGGNSGSYASSTRTSSGPYGSSSRTSSGSYGSSTRANSGSYGSSTRTSSGSYGSSTRTGNGSYLSSSNSFDRVPSPSSQNDSYQHRMLPGGKESSDDSDDSFYERFQDPEENCSFNSKLSSSPDVASALDCYDSSSKVNEVVKRNLRSLITSYPSGLWACVLPEKYKEKFGVQLNWNELGFDSVIQMAHDLPDIFHCKRVQSGDWMLFDVSSNTSVDDCNDTNSDINVPQSVKRKVFDIVKRYTSGIRGEQLAQLYEEYYGKTLSSESPGFNCLEDLFSSLHNTVIRVRYIRKECYVYPGEMPEDQIMPSLKVDLHEKQLLGLYPEEVMGPGDTFLPPQLPSNLEPGDYIELRVAEVYHPQKFWIMLRKDSFTLNKLMDELQDFYGEHGAKYVMPDCTIVEGQCCVAIYDSEWHRSVIKTVGETIEVVYVDYGTVSKCPRKDLRFIHRDFSILPKQAIRASLSGIQPSNGAQRFTKEASFAFLNLVIDRALIGLIQKADLEEPFLELFLIDTNGETDVHLNDVLVTEGHATFKDDLLETSELIKEINGELEASSLLQEERQECTEETHNEETIVCPVSMNSQDVPVVSSSTKCSGLSSEPVCQKSPPTSSIQPSSNLSQPQGTSVSHMPPPGFGAMDCQTPASGFGAAGSYPYALNPYNPLLNSALTAYSTPGLAQLSPQQVSAALLMQQQWQQQQAMALAYYQNLYQQSVALLSAQASTTAGNNWSSSIYQQQTNNNTSNNDTKPFVSQHNLSEISSSDRFEEMEKSKHASTGVEMEELTSSSSDDYYHRNVPVVRKKKPSHSISSHSKSLQRNFPCDSDQSDDSLVPSSSSSCRNVTPDLVQSVGNLNLSHSKSSTVTNFWKTVDIEGHTFHLFNIDQKAYVSTGELARKFTEFRTGETLVRVLKNMDIVPPYSKLTRQERLPLFSALDGFDEDIKCFDLIRNKNGAVIGTFHLTPLTNVPSMLIALKLDASIVKEFRLLRDSFNPAEEYWTE